MSRIHGYPAKPFNKTIRRRMVAAGLLLLLLFASSSTCLVTVTAQQNSTTYIQIVHKANPNLQWTPPAPIPFGEALSSIQLSATSTTPGSMTYSPGQGAILQPGTQTLSVTYKPDNPSYLNASATVPLTVIPPGDSGFGVGLDTSVLDGPDFILSPGKTVNIPLLVTPTSGFYQPVSFRCAPSPIFRCMFNPSVARPTTAPKQVMLTVLWVQPSLTTQSGSAIRAPSQTPPAPGEPSPFFLSCILLAACLRLRKRIGESCHGIAPLCILACALALCTSTTACANRYKFYHLTVTASSLVESHSFSITILEPVSGF